MEIEKDKSGNIWIDNELCINIPIKVNHISRLQQRLKGYSYEDLTEIVNDSIYYYLYERRD